MDLDLKREWIDALRSGDYRQGRHCLRQNRYEFCGVGVLGDLLVQRGEAEWRHSALRDVQTGRFAFGSLPYRLAETAGIDDATLASVIALNDSKQLPFVEIADWIKQHVPEDVD